MASSMKGFEHLEIPLEEIKSATNNFNEENVIGHGGFGKVYKGELSHSHSTGKSMVALKRLDRRHGQGDAEFHKEVRMLSCYRHENIISLLGFSRGRDEMILVYEYASRGSLDGYLKDVNLTWTQRLKICLDAAKGLSYLHDPRETNQRLIHCDIKSANILLDENFNAKVSDFGLSKIGPANQQNSILVTGALGTPGYCDPVFMETYTLTKESDIYSFGVVLFEVLCGKLCIEYSKGQLKVIHVPLWKQSYEENKLDEIILQDLMQQMDPSSLHTFTEVAYQCLQNAREERPTMSLVVEKLEIALQMQVLPKEYIEIANAAGYPLLCRSLEEFKKLLSKGVLLNGGKTWFSLNEKGQNCHMMSMKDCLILNEDSTPRYMSHSWSRFPTGFYLTNKKGFKTHVKTQFLSPSITYTINLVWCSISGGRQLYVDLKYRISGEPTTSTVHLSNKREDLGLYMAELYQFTSDGSIVDLEIIFEKFGANIVIVEGILFQPLEIVEDQVSKNDKVENIQTISDSESDTYWEQNPNDYEEILKFSKDSQQWTTKKELYSILRRGFPINNGQEWFTIDIHGKKCLMLSARATWVTDDENSACESSHESRFGEVLVITAAKKFEIKTEVKSKVVSPETAYAAYLVFKLPQDQSTFETPIKVEDVNNPYLSSKSFIYLVSPPVTPFIRPKFDENTYNPLNRYKGTDIPHQRSDGWMEVKLWEFQATTEAVRMHLIFKHPDKKNLKGLIVQGIELRPI